MAGSPVAPIPQPLPNAVIGSIVCAINNAYVQFPPSVDNCVLITSHNDPAGYGLAWSNAPTLFSLNVGFLQVANSIMVAGGIGVNGVNPPVLRANYPGTGSGDNADTINAIVAILTSCGFCKGFPATTSTLSGGAATGTATVQIATPFTVTLSGAAPAGGVVITPAGTLSGDTFQAALSGANVSTVTIAEGGTTVNFYYTPGADGTCSLSFTTAPVTTYAGTPVAVVVSG